MRKPYGGGRSAPNIFGAKTKAAPKPIKPFAQKNPHGALESQNLALQALSAGLCLCLTYDRLPRTVEVHTIGITTAGRPAMSAFQVDGQSNTPPIPDWRLFCFDECWDVAVSDVPSTAPRPDYKKGAKQFARIIAEL